MRTREKQRKTKRVVRTMRRRPRRRLEGLTLVEIMVVLVIVAIIGTGVAIGVFAFIDDAEVSTAEQSVRQIRQVANIEYRRTRECPTVQTLAESGKIDEDSSLTDPWDKEYQIDCQPRLVIVTSAGPDGQFETEDDIAAPRNRSGQQ
jgi:prepilin-type N-terminal cleavage/methylation domain-containing protein